MSNISVKKAALISAISKYSTTILNLVFTAVLARLLTPEDYGVVVVSFVFISFFQIIADLGLGSAVIQHKELTKQDVNNIFSFTVRLSILLAVAFSLFSIPLSLFYKNTVYIPIGLILAVALIFSTLNIIPNALLMKEKQFLVVGIRTFVIAMLGSVLAIILAFCGFKYYALVLQSVFVAILTFLWNYWSTRPKFSIKYNKISVEKVRNFSSFQFGFNIINYFARNSDNLLIGKFMGEATLGYYDKAYKLMLYPVQNLTHVITPVLHPILSDYQNDKEYIYKKYMDIVKVLSLLGILVSSICFLAADEIILIVFGELWKEAITPFRILSLSVWAQMVTSSTGAIFQSLGNTKLMFQAGTVSAVLTVSCIALGLIKGNLFYLSIFVAIGFNCSFIINFAFLILKGFQIKFREFIKRFIPDMFIASIMIVVIALYPLNISNIIFSIIAKVMVVVFVYVTFLILTQQYKIFLVLIKKR
ncbi:lipopolysaccharide biosynthesis protein [Priestia megaterium]|uniref:lipopolysaccharide biosynthesis protein n=1 Tax=Priestia megaterium TaxID=1404 RepID=UPI00387A7E4A